MRPAAALLLALTASGCTCTELGCGGIVLLDLPLSGPSEGATVIACHDEACETFEVPWGSEDGARFSLDDGTTLSVGAARIGWISPAWELPEGIEVGDLYSLEVLADDATPLGSDQRTVVALGEVHPNGPYCPPDCVTVTLE